MFVRKQALGESVHTIDLIYSFQVLIIIEPSFSLLCQEIVKVGESCFDCDIPGFVQLVQTTGFDYYNSYSSSLSVDSRTCIG